MRSAGKTAALEQLSTDEQVAASELLSLLSQPVQPLCPEAPASDAIAIWGPISPACTAERPKPRARETPRKRARNRLDDRCFMAVNMAAMSPRGKEESHHSVGSGLLAGPAAAGRCVNGMFNNAEIVKQDRSTLPLPAAHKKCEIVRAMMLRQAIRLLIPALLARRSRGRWSAKPWAPRRVTRETARPSSRQ